MSLVYWFTIMGWNMRSPTLTAWARRRPGQIAMIRKYHPAVFLGVEVGSPIHARWITRQLSRGSHIMRRAPYGGKWRYIWYDPKRVNWSASGLFTLPHKWKGDAKQAAWMLASVDGHMCLFISAHLENKGTEANRVNQMHDVFMLAERLRKLRRLDRKYVFIYVDCNSDGAVQKYIEGTPYSSLMNGAKRKVGTGWTSQNRFLRRIGIGRKVRAGHPSMDLILSGDERNAMSIVQPDGHVISDHDPLIAAIAKIR